MKERTGHLVMMIICAIIAIPLIFGIFGCSKGPYLEPEQSTTIEEWERDMQENPPGLSILPPSDGVRSTWTGRNRAWGWAAAFGQTADAITTVNGLSGNCREVNPLFGSDPGATEVVLVKLAVIGGAVWVVEYYLRNSSLQARYRDWVYGSLAVVGIGAAAWNINQHCN